MLQGFGLNTPDEGIILSRDLGVTLLSIGALNWLARDATGTALRAVLIGNLSIQVLEIVVNGYEIATGMLPGAAAGGLVIHAALGVVFLLALMRTRGTRANSDSLRPNAGVLPRSSGLRFPAR